MTKNPPLSIQQQGPLGKESIMWRSEAGLARAALRMTGAGNQDYAERGLGLLLISVAQPWPELQAQMEHFLALS